MKPNIIYRSMCISVLLILLSAVPLYGDNHILNWSELPELPPAKDQSTQPGLAGAFVGIHNNALIIAGGANFPNPVWESNKVWHDDIYVLVKNTESSASDDVTYNWVTGFKLDKPVAYGSSVSTSHGVVCIGGNDSEKTFSEVFLLQWDPEEKKIKTKQLPNLPSPLAYSSATSIDNKVYVAGGTTGLGLETAQSCFWSLDLSEIQNAVFEWQRLPSWPGPPRAFAILAAQHNNRNDCVYLISGRWIGTNGEIEFLTDVYEFTPEKIVLNKIEGETGVYAGKTNPWRKRTDVPRCVMAGTGIGIGQSHVFVLGGADGSLFHQADALKDEHPGFPTEALMYHTITDTWTSAGPIPANHVTTTAVRWGENSILDPIVIASGEVRPRVRSPKIWLIRPGIDHIEDQRRPRSYHRRCGTLIHEFTSTTARYSRYCDLLYFRLCRQFYLSRLAKIHCGIDSTSF